MAGRELTTLFSGGFTFAIRFLRSAYFMPMIDVYAVGSGACKVQHVDQVVRLPPGAVHEPLAEGICVDSQERHRAGSLLQPLKESRCCVCR
jgi:aspartate oxidase